MAFKIRDGITIMSKSELEQFKNLVACECKCGFCFVADINSCESSDVHCNQVYYSFKCPDCDRNIEVTV